MNGNHKQPKTLQEAVVFYADPNNALAYMTLLRWPDGIVACPACGRTDVVFLHNQRKWQCKSVHAKRQFSAKVGTIFEDSPIPLEKWLVVVWMLSNCRNGISSYEIGRTIGVTQKSAWFMLHRIRLGLQGNNFDTTMRKLLAVSHDEIKAKLDAEKAVKQKRKANKPSASGRAVSGKG